MTTTSTLSPAPVNFLSDDDLFGDRPLPIFIPRKNGYVYIRPPRADEAIRFYRRDANETDEQAEDKRLQLIALCLCDENGNPRLKPEEYHRVRTMGADVFTILSEEVARLISGKTEFETVTAEVTAKETTEVTGSAVDKPNGSGGDSGDSGDTLGNAATGGSLTTESSGSLSASH